MEAVNSHAKLKATLWMPSSPRKFVGIRKSRIETRFGGICEITCWEPFSQPWLSHQLGFKFSTKCKAEE